jgi:thiol-disulfide isomerase/thioredoxin
VRVRKPAITLGTLCLVAALAIGVIQAGNNSNTSTTAKPPTPLTRAQVAKAIPGAPAPLAALRGRVSELAGGGTKAFDAQLRALRGYPVVVNAWAEWCHPCRYELPFFQREAVARGGKVAFLGINAKDDADKARSLAARIPLPYPSFVDHGGDLIRRFRAVGLPVTIFYDASGKRQMVHQGVFPSEQALSAAIDRYATR